MADDRLGRVAKSRARRNGAAGPVDVFGQRNSEPANAIKEFASAEHVSSPCKTLLLYVGFEVEREHTLERLDACHEHWVRHQHTYASTHEIEPVQGINPFCQPFRFCDAIGVDKGQNLACR